MTRGQQRPRRGRSRLWLRPVWRSAGRSINCLASRWSAQCWGRLWSPRGRSLNAQHWQRRGGAGVSWHEDRLREGRLDGSIVGNPQRSRRPKLLWWIFGTSPTLDSNLVSPPGNTAPASLLTVMTDLSMTDLTVAVSTYVLKFLLICILTDLFANTSTDASVRAFTGPGYWRWHMHLIDEVTYFWLKKSPLSREKRPIHLSFQKS